MEATAEMFNLTGQSPGRFYKMVIAVDSSANSRSINYFNSNETTILGSSVNQPA